MKLRKIRLVAEERLPCAPDNLRNRNAIEIEMKRRVMGIQKEYRKPSYNAALAYQFEERLSDLEAQAYKTRMAEGKFSTGRSLLSSVEEDFYIQDEFCYRNFFTAVAKSASAVYGTLYQDLEALKKSSFDVMTLLQDALSIHQLFLAGNFHGTSFGLTTVDLYADPLFMTHSLVYIGKDLLGSIYKTTLDNVMDRFERKTLGSANFADFSPHNEFDNEVKKALTKLIKSIKYTPLSVLKRNIYLQSRGVEE